MTTKNDYNSAPANKRRILNPSTPNRGGGKSRMKTNGLKTDEKAPAVTPTTKNQPTPNPPSEVNILGDMM